MINYEREQKELIEIVTKGEGVLQDNQQKSDKIRLLIQTFREQTSITELTPTLVNKLIERIEVHNNDKSSGQCYVKVDIYFTGAGMFEIPSVDRIQQLLEEVRKNPDDHRLVA